MLPRVVIPEMPYLIASSALGLMLVFRTDASFERYEEARSAWEKAKRHVWDLSRQGFEWCGDEALRAQLVRHALAFMRTLKTHVRSSGQARRAGEWGGAPRTGRRPPFFS